MKTIQHATEVLTGDWRTDGDIDAACIRILDSGAKDVPYLLSNPLGREPIGVQIIKKNKACDVYTINSTRSSLTVKFTVDNCDLTLRIW